MIGDAIGGIVGASLAQMNMAGCGGGGGGGYSGTFSQYHQGQLQQAALSQQAQILGVSHKSAVKPKEEIKMDSQILPDISLSRVFKWAIVFIVALTLGKKAWGLFGEKITANLHKALDQAAQ